MPPKEADKHPSILVADDESGIRMIIQKLLASEGYAVSTAPDGQEAIKLIRELKPDLILTDINMPHANGYEVCRTVKGDPSLQHIPVLALTVLTSSDERVKVLDAGADDFINKPFAPSELLARVRAFLRAKNLHDELEKSYIKLKELETLRDALTGMIVHDLKSPLSVISGSILVALDGFAQNKPTTSEDITLLKNAEAGCRQMMGLLSDILDVSRMEQKQLPLEKAPSSPQKIIEKCLEQLDPLRVKYKIDFKREIEPGMPDVAVDPVIINRVLTNIISNSLKFTPKGGSVTVYAKKAGNEFEVAVQDTGMGIPDKDLERVFEKFYQGSNLTTTRKGQGVGLTFCKMAVEAHGGRIWAESKDGEGSRFVIRLPM